MFSQYKPSTKLTLRNKMIMAPMTTWASNDDLTVSDEELEYYKIRSKALGAVITATTFFKREGQGFSGQFSAENDTYIESLKKLADAIHEGGAKAVLQVFHVGRMGDPEKGTEAPSPVPGERNPYVEEGQEIKPPRELTIEEIKELEDGFYSVTKRAIEAGYDGIEIHGANTYLIQQFFSRASNKRKDEYGGSIENRMRFSKNIIEKVLEAKKNANKSDFLIGYRLSPEEVEEDGITLDETLVLVEELVNADINYIHLSLGRYDQSSLRDKEDKRPVGKVIAEKIDGRKALVGVGEIKELEDLTKASHDIGYDAVAIGRALVTDPYWVKHVARGDDPEDTLHLDRLKEQVVPRKMAEKIASRPGWFKVDGKLD